MIAGIVANRCITSGHLYGGTVRYIVKITIMAAEHRLHKGYLLVMLLFSEYLKVRCHAVPAIVVAGCFGRHKCIDLR